MYKNIANEIYQWIDNATKQMTMIQNIYQEKKSNMNQAFQILNTK